MSGARNTPIQLNAVSAPGKDLGCLLREENPAQGQPLRAALLCKCPCVSSPRQPGLCSHLPITSDCSRGSWAAFFMKQPRVHPLPVPHIATCCHGNDGSLGDIGCRRCGRGRVVLIGKPDPLPPRQRQRLGWDLEDAPCSDCKSRELRGLLCVCRELFLPRVFPSKCLTNPLSSFAQDTMSLPGSAAQPFVPRGLPALRALKQHPQTPPRGFSPTHPH